MLATPVVSWAPDEVSVLAAPLQPATRVKLTAAVTATAAMREREKPMMDMPESFPGNVSELSGSRGRFLREASLPPGSGSADRCGCRGTGRLMPSEALSGTGPAIAGNHVNVEQLLANAPEKLVNSLKSVSSRRMRQEFPDLVRHYYRANRLWSGSSFAGSVGGAPSSIVRQYVSTSVRRAAEPPGSSHPRPEARSNGPQPGSGGVRSAPERHNVGYEPARLPSSGGPQEDLAAVRRTRLISVNGSGPVRNWPMTHARFSVAN